jgi:hypothetical protein
MPPVQLRMGWPGGLSVCESVSLKATASWEFCIALSVRVCQSESSCILGISYCSQCMSLSVRERLHLGNFVLLSWAWPLPLWLQCGCSSWSALQAVSVLACSYAWRCAAGVSLGAHVAQSVCWLVRPHGSLWPVANV